jgi:hypothetical protein
VSLLVERYTPTGWTVVGELPPCGSPGSMSHNPIIEQGDAEREVITFTCHGDHSLIERSVGGADEERGVLRKITSIGFETIARLEAGQSIELMIRTDKSRMASRIRFTHVEGP